MPCSLRLHGGGATTSKHSSSGGGGGSRSAAQGMPSSIAAQRQGIYDDSGMEQPSAVAPRRARVQVAPYDSYSEDVTTKGKISDLPSIEPVASRSPETLSQGARKAMTRALSLNAPALAAEVELTLCESVRIVADGAVSSKAPALSAPTRSAVAAAPLAPARSAVAAAPPAPARSAERAERAGGGSAGKRAFYGSAPWEEDEKDHLRSLVESYPNGMPKGRQWGDVARQLAAVAGRAAHCLFAE